MERRYAEHIPDVQPPRRLLQRYEQGLDVVLRPGAHAEARRRQADAEHSDR